MRLLAKQHRHSLGRMVGQVPAYKLVAGSGAAISSLAIVCMEREGKRDCSMHFPRSAIHQMSRQQKYIGPRTKWSGAEVDTRWWASFRKYNPDYSTIQLTAAQISNAALSSRNIVEFDEPKATRLSGVPLRHNPAVVAVRFE